MESHSHCPKCGRVRPKLEERVTRMVHIHGYSCRHEERMRAITYSRGVEGYPSKESRCECWHKPLLRKERPRRGCGRCNGTGTAKFAGVESVPEHLLVTCPACLYEWKETPLDKRQLKEE